MFYNLLRYEYIIIYFKIRNCISMSRCLNSHFFYNWNYKIPGGKKLKILSHVLFTIKYRVF